MSTTELFQAIDAGDVAAVRALVEDEPALASARNEDGLPAVLAALYGHHAEIVDALLAARPELDVFEAAAVGDLERLRALLDADPSQADAYAPDGFFPLALAAFFGQAAAIALLLERGADVGATARNPMRVQALHSAVAGRNAEGARLLVEAGADPNVHQHGGWTPLQGAAAHGDRPIVDLLLAHGADRAATNEAGDDAATLARKHGHASLADALAAPQAGHPARG
jgi:ankyrin repeat protein